jgi:hypothetical protein
VKESERREQMLKEQTLFEAWINKNWVASDLSKDSQSHYIRPIYAHMFEGWMARAKLPATGSQ